MSKLRTILIEGLRPLARRLEPELMDDPGIDRKAHEAALHGLARINSISGAAKPIARELCGFVRAGDPPLRVLDVATGSGDVLLEVERRCRERGVQIEVSGCDVSEFAVELARQRAHEQSSGAGFFVHDVIAQGVPSGYDVVMCSLFLHHLTRDAAVALLGDMWRRARCGIVISDLKRSWIGLNLAMIVPPLVTRSTVVHSDAVRSALAAFTLDEFRDMMRDANIGRCEIRRIWPERAMLVGRKFAEGGE